MDETNEELNEENETNEEVKETEIVDSSKEIEEMKDRLQRTMAEFDNYKKRTAKEKIDLHNSITSDIIESILPVIDSLEKAIEVAEKDESIRQGIELIQKQFLSALANYNVEPIKALGEKFDPELHEAVSHIEDEKYGEQEIVQEFRVGYKVGSKIIRHSMVVVAN